jgi:hypothetical protein
MPGWRLGRLAAIATGLVGAITAIAELSGQNNPSRLTVALWLIVAVGACLLGVVELIKVRAEDAQPHRPSADEASGNWPHHVNVTIGLFVVSALIAGVLYMLSLKEPTAGPTPDSGVPELPTVPAITLADPRAADPCSLLDPKDLARFGQAAIETGVGRFTECNVEIDLPGDAVVDVNAEFLTPLAADQTVPGNVQSLGGLIIGRTPANSNDCKRTILLTDRTQIRIMATDFKPPAAPVDFCDIAETAMRTAIRVLAVGGLRDRPLSTPESLIGVDACGLLDASALSRLEGLKSRRSDRWVRELALRVAR